MSNRKEWYPVVSWPAKVIERRLELGREVLMPMAFLDLVA